jgi:hypothetical protein
MDQTSIDSHQEKDELKKNHPWDAVIISGILLLGNIVVPAFFYFQDPNDGSHVSIIAPAFWLNIVALVLSCIVAARGQKEKGRSLPLLFVAIILSLMWGLFYIFSPLASGGL